MVSNTIKVVTSLVAFFEIKTHIFTIQHDVTFHCRINSRRHTIIFEISYSLPFLNNGITYVYSTEFNHKSIIQPGNYLSTVIGLTNSGAQVKLHLLSEGEQA